MATLMLRRPDLVDRLQGIAEREGTTVGALRKMHARLVDEYAGDYVAIHDGEVVDHDPDVRALHLRIRQRYGRAPILLRQVTEEIEQQDMVFRSPRVETFG